MNTLQQVLIYSGMVITSLSGSTDPRSNNDSGNKGSVLNDTPGFNPASVFIDRNQEVLISPNPNSGYFVLTLPPAVAESKGSIQITNLMGFPVYNTDYFPEHGNKLTIEMLGTKPGVHFLVVTSGNERLVTKFILK